MDEMAEPIIKFSFELIRHLKVEKFFFLPFSFKSNDDDDEDEDCFTSWLVHASSDYERGSLKSSLELDFWWLRVWYVSEWVSECERESQCKCVVTERSECT